jgi:hypothetical protein
MLHFESSSLLSSSASKDFILFSKKFTDGGLEIGASEAKD